MPGLRPTLLDPYEALHVLRVSGFADADAVAEATLSDPTAAAAALHDLAERRLALHREALGKHGLTAEGRTAHAAWVVEQLEASGQRSAVETAYEVFLASNETFKTLCTDYQLAVAGGEDPAGPGPRALEALRPVHGSVQGALGGLSQALDRYAGYPPRFDRALARLESGDWTALAAPLSASYHDVWMALHEDLLCTLGRTRSPAADGS
jgi:hypothetical protein